MKREELQEIIQESKYYESDSGIRLVLAGLRKPPIEVIDYAYSKGVPILAWLDIKTYMNSNEDDKAS